MFTYFLQFPIRHQQKSVYLLKSKSQRSSIHRSEWTEGRVEWDYCWSKASSLFLWLYKPVPNWTNSCALIVIVIANHFVNLQLLVLRLHDCIQTLCGRYNVTSADRTKQLSYNNTHTVWLWTDPSVTVPFWTYFLCRRCASTLCVLNLLMAVTSSFQDACTSFLNQ